MATYRLTIRSAAAEVIRHLPPGIKRAVRSALDSLGRGPAAGEALHGELEGRFKLRVRRFRIIYSIDRTARVVNILAVGHRRNIYEEFAETQRGDADRE